VNPADRRPNGAALPLAWISESDTPVCAMLFPDGDSIRRTAKSRDESAASVSAAPPAARIQVPSVSWEIVASPEAASVAAAEGRAAAMTASVIAVRSRPNRRGRMQLAEPVTAWLGPVLYAKV
jgi:hypothetical protein